MGRSAWAAVVIGSEWEVPPQVSALRGNVLMSVPRGVTGNGLDVICRVLTESVWLMVRELTLDKQEERKAADWTTEKRIAASEYKGRVVDHKPLGGRTEDYGPGAETLRGGAKHARGERW